MPDPAIQLAKNGKNCFRDIFHTYYQPLYYLSISYLKDEEEAKSVVQEAFIKLWEIEEKLGISQKTVEAHLTKALKILRNDLKDYLPVIIAITKILN